MSSRLRRHSGQVAALLPQPALERARLAVAAGMELSARRSRAVRGAALVLHSVAPAGGDPLLEIDPPLEAQRLEQLAGYLARRYTLVKAADLPAAARARGRGERLPVAMTFDDDLPSHRDHAAPILRRQGVVATAFLCGADRPFWWQLLQVAVDARAIAADALPGVPERLVADALERRPRAIHRAAKAIEDLPATQREQVAAVLADAVPAPPPVLGREGAQELARAGWELGFHTRRHDLLTKLGDDELRAALASAGEARTIAYPHGKATAREAAAARAAGYVAGYTGRDEVFTERSDDHRIGRLQPDTATVGRFALQLARALLPGS